MALPNLEEYLPEDLHPTRELHDASAALDQHERRLAHLEDRIADLREAVDRFIDDLEKRRGLTETDLAALYNELSQSGARLQDDLHQYLQEADSCRKSISEWRDESLRDRTLAVFDREAEVLRSALAAYESGGHRLLVLRDKLLVREGQEMSFSAFWANDES